MVKHLKFLYWLVSFCLLVFSSVLAHNFGLWQVMDEKDVTKISWLICIITVFSSMYIGYMSYIKSKSAIAINRLWFITDALITLGMIGTVAGFLIMLGDSFTNIDISDPITIQKTIQTMGIGMGTVLITTLMGLIGSVYLKAQLVLMDDEQI
jgi:hypothetical protein